MGNVTSTKKTNVTVTAGGRKKIITRQQLRKYSWLPDVLRLQGSIVPKIFGPVLTVTLFATAAAYAWHKGTNITLSNSVIPLFSVVVGLILVFRNGTSYDRYYEGRKDFQSMISHVRNLSRLIWVNVAVPPADDKGKLAGATLTAKQLRRKKVTALKLCVCFAFAVKHYLRGEDGLDWDDYAGILPPTVARLAAPGGSRRTSAWTSYAATERTSREDSAAASGDEGGSPARQGTTDSGARVDATKRIRVKRSKDKMKQAGVRSSKTPLLSGLHQTIDFNSDPESLTTPLPLVISHELARMIFMFKRDGYLETIGPAGTNAMNQLVQSMVDALSNMERVANTPIPRSYSIHLKQTVTLYLFSLPFTLVKELGWAMIPLVTVIAFTLMGIEGIADEIEMPFGLDKSDLPLERYCQDLKEEVEYVVERLPEGGEGMYGYDDGQGDD
ncbi:Bestrophin, RFP-TM, chloride channel-domain-containing protein [Phanerochaete sordida]|uniref:Bestrophin, RFP-TM, chloride channel-domain-containing protein n=1 Tax=Phanerochaete sordida TaxID=48140 RepID=A0A9P3GLC3_9APHY|nr:Bestrophin, RFP-TM, chloride channel-domain-containing protein [Phanerochaete sordida]